MGYAALPAFFVLYAENVLGVTAAQAALVLAGFGWSPPPPCSPAVA